jgi:hypothetical protein
MGRQGQQENRQPPQMGNQRSGHPDAQRIRTSQKLRRPTDQKTQQRQSTGHFDPQTRPRYILYSQKQRGVQYETILQFLTALGWRVLARCLTEINRADLILSILVM